MYNKLTLSNLRASKAFNFSMSSSLVVALAAAADAALAPATSANWAGVRLKPKSTSCFHRTSTISLSYIVYRYMR